MAGDRVASERPGSSTVVGVVPRDRAVVGELAEVGPHAEAGDGPQDLGHVGVDRRHQRRRCRRRRRRGPQRPSTWASRSRRWVEVVVELGGRDPRSRGRGRGRWPCSAGRQRRRRSSDVEVVGHVAVERGDDHGGAVHDVVAGEQQPLLVPAGSRGGCEAWPGVWTARSVNSVPSMRVAVDEVAVAHQAVAVGERQDLGAGALLEAGGPRRVVGVGVGAQDPPDAAAAGRGDGVEVLGVVGTRVDDRDLVDADQVGVGARARSSSRGCCSRTRRTSLPRAMGTLGDRGSVALGSLGVDGGHVALRGTEARWPCGRSATVHPVDRWRRAAPAASS